jgi:hypothetical protein
MATSGGSGRSAASVPAALFVAATATFVQSYVGVKLLFLAVYLVTAVVGVARERKALVYPRLVVFYVALSVTGIIWAIVGLLHPGNYVVGAFDALRLYCIWSIAFLVLFSLLRAHASLRWLHDGMVLSGLLISVINLVAVADQILGWGLITDSIRDQMELRVGIHEGYIQITSNNIGALFVVVPYLLALQFRADAGKLNSPLTKLSLVLCLVVAAVSGRRALWLVVAVAPWAILALAVVTKNQAALRAAARRFTYAYTLAAVALLGLILVRPDAIAELGYVGRLQQAFSVEDERTIQKPYLLHSFEESPILGSGFGAYAGYLRNEERPWTYELTYHQMLFNLGVVGLILLGGLISLYFVLVVRTLRECRDRLAIRFSVLVGFCGLLVGAYSNPYLRSFDYLFFAGLLPFLSTFRRGFAASPSEEAS